MDQRTATVAAHGLAWLAALMALSVALAAPPALTLDGAWVRWIPAPVPNTALYGVLVNATDHDVRLVGATTVVAASCMPMTTREESSGTPSGPVVSMVQVDGLSVPAHGQRALEPGGDHLMLIGLKEALSEGTDVEITLRFEGAPPLTVRVPVLRK